MNYVQFTVSRSSPDDGVVMSLPRFPPIEFDVRFNHEAMRQFADYGLSPIAAAVDSIRTEALLEAYGRKRL